MIGLAASPPPTPPQRNTSSVFVRAEALAAMRADFARNIKVRVSGQDQDLQGTRTILRWGSLAALIPSPLPADVADAGVRFYYGLDATDRFTLGFEIVLLQKVSEKVEPYVNDAEVARMFSLQLPLKTFYTVSAAGEPVVTDRDVWMADMHDRYKEKIRIRRTDKDTQLAPYHKYLDPASETFPWGMELAKLASDNNMAATDTLTIDCIGDRSGWMVVEGDTVGSDYQHSLCLYFEGHIGNGISPDAGHPFRDRGANLGTLCPSRCDLYVRPCELP